MKSDYGGTSRPIQFNMTPIIDVVLLLIVFFLVSSHLARQETQMQLNLPTASSGRKDLAENNPRVTVNVAADGQVSLGGAIVTPTELHSRLAYEQKRTNGNLEVRIRGDRLVAYRVVEPIFLAAARAGVWNVTIAVVQKQ